MTDKVDGRLVSVPIASYAYRHEAEFAAGFLDDAGIAYRLQVDDAAMTMSMGASATLWVRGIDVPLAREILELPSGGAVGTLARPRDARAVRPVASTSPAKADVPQRAYAPDPAASGRAELSSVERVTALLLCMGLVAVGSLLPTTPAMLVLAAPLGALAMVLLLSGLVGRAFAPIRALLRALSGNA